MSALPYAHPRRNAYGEPRTGDRVRLHTVAYGPVYGTVVHTNEHESVIQCDDGIRRYRFPDDITVHWRAR